MARGHRRVFTPFLYEPELLHQEPVIRDLTARLFSGLSFREKQPEFLISLALPYASPTQRVLVQSHNQGANIPPASWPNTRNISNVITNSIKAKNGLYEKYGCEKGIHSLGGKKVKL